MTVHSVPPQQAFQQYKKKQATKPFSGYGLSLLFILITPVIVSLLTIMKYAPNATQFAVRNQAVVYGMAVVIGFILWLARKKYFSEIGWGFLLLIHFVWFAQPVLKQAINGVRFGEWSFGAPPSHNSVMYGGTYIAVFLFLNGLTYLIFRRMLYKKTDFQEKLSDEFAFSTKNGVKVAFLLILFGLAPLIIYGGGLTDIIREVLLGRGDKSWALSPGSAEAYKGSLQQTFFWLSRASLVAGGVLSGAYAITGKNIGSGSRIFLYAMLLLATLIVYFDQGTRSLLAMLLVPIMVLYAYKKATTGDGLSAKKMLFTGGFLALLLLLTTQFQLFYRNTKDFRETADTVTLEDLSNPDKQTDFYSETAHAIVAERLMRQLNKTESPVYMVLINPIPRALWPNKPLSQIQWVYTLSRGGNRDIYRTGGNMLPSVVGQYYMSYGILGVLWAGVFYGLMAVWFEGFVIRANRLESQLFGLSGLTFLFVVARHLAPGFHYSTAIIGVLLLLANMFKEKKKPHFETADIAV